VSEPVLPLLHSGWAHGTDARYTERVEEAWIAARHRVLDRQALRPLPPTPAGLRALVAVELEEPGGEVTALRSLRWLAPGGAAVVWNDKARNPVRLIHTVVQRRGLRAPVFERRDPVDGSPVAYAHEAITTARRVARFLAEGGCCSVAVRYANVVPSVLVRNPRLRRVVGPAEWLARVPGLRAVVGGDYCVVGRTSAP